MALVKSDVPAADDRNAYNNKIWEEIHYYEAIAEEYSETVNDCGMQIKELQSLREILIQTDTDFESRQQLRRDAAQKIAQLPDIIHMGIIFAEGMKELLNGEKYRAVSDGICRAVGKTDSKIEELEEKIQYCRSMISDLEEAQWVLYKNLL